MHHINDIAASPDPVFDLARSRDGLAFVPNMAGTVQSFTPRDLYATEKARIGALDRGFDFSIGDWRTIFIAITDACVQPSERVQLGHVQARLLGTTRNGERWAITWKGRHSFDVVYDPHRPIVVSVTDPLSRPFSPLPAPNDPRRPINGGAMVSA